MDKWTEHIYNTPPKELLEEIKEVARQNGIPASEGIITYKVAINGKEDIARIIINFLNCTLIKKREASVFNTKDEPKYLPGYYAPYNAYAAKYDQRNVPDRDQLDSILETNDYMFTCVAAFDREDKKRIKLFKFPTLDTDLALRVYFPDYDENKILKIIKYIEEYNPLDPM